MGWPLLSFLYSYNDFDVISCQFAMHYMWKTKETATKFIKLISTLLKPGGVFIATTTDADVMISNLLNTQGNKERKEKDKEKEKDKVKEKEKEKEKDKEKDKEKEKEKKENYENIFSIRDEKDRLLCRVEFTKEDVERLFKNKSKKDDPMDFTGLKYQF